MLCFQPFNPKLRNNYTNKHGTVVTTSKCKSAAQFRPCPSQRLSATNHTRVLQVHCPVLRGITCIYSVSLLECFRMCHDHLLPNSYLLTISFISSENLVLSEKLIVSQTFKKLPTLYGIRNSITVHTRLHR